VGDEHAARAEILKLARLLQVDPARLAYLERVKVQDLRALRDQVTEALFAAHDGALRRLAATSRLLPVALVASLTRSTFGPVLAARVAGLLEPERADEVGQRLPTEFVADIAIELDPRRASAVISRIPPERIHEITTVLALRQEHVTMGRFVGHLDDDALSAALGALSDEDLVQTLVVMEEPLDLERLTRLAGQERVDRLAAMPGSPVLSP
jgi:hypothetical protein